MCAHCGLPGLLDRFHATPRRGGALLRASCNQFNRRRDFPSDYDSVYGKDPEAVVTRGGSCIVDPFGNFLAGPNTEDEVILTAEIDRGQIIRGKYDLDIVGHYARPDIFQLQVDERPKRPVTTESGAAADEERPSLQTSYRAVPGAKE